MRFVFVIPCYRGANQYYSPPLGIGYVIAALKECGHSVHTINLNETSQDLQTCLKNYQTTDVVCTGGLSVYFNEINGIISTANAMGLTTVLGGGIITAEPEFIYDTIAPTYGIIGEGEHAMVQLADRMKAEPKSFRELIFSHIDGLVWKRNGVTTVNPPKPIEDIDTVAFPDYDAIGMPGLLSLMNGIHEPYFHHEDNPRMIPIVTSRSCPYGCSFCFSPTGKKYRQRSLDNIFTEIEKLIRKYNPNIFMFLDELFAAKKDRVEAFCERIKKYDVTWICQLHVKSVDRDTLLLMKDAGCVCVSWGIESHNDDVLKGMHKSSTKSDIDRVTQLCYENGIGIQGNLIFGTEQETIDTWNESLLWWKENRKYMIHLTPVWAYPGSELYRKAIEQKKIVDKKQWLELRCQPVNITEISDDQYHECIMDLIALQQTSDSSYIFKDVTVQARGKDGMGRNIASVTYTCPHCSQTTTINNLLSGYPCGRKFYRYACRKCNQRSDFSIVI